MIRIHHTATQKLLGGIAPLLLLFLLSTSGCSKNEPLKVGFVGGLSGRVADLGISGRNGVQLAIEEQNRIGGISGRRIKLITEDDQQDKDAALKGVQSLIDQKVAVIIGHMTSSMSMATQSLINKHNILMMSPTTTTNDLSGLDDNFIRVCGSTKEYATKLAQYMLKTMSDKSVVVIYDLKNKAYTEDWVSDFRQTFEGGGGKILKEETYYSGPDAHFQKAVENVMLPEAKGLVICSSSLDAATICQQVRKLDWQISIALSSWAATEKLIDIGGLAVEGVTVSQFFDRQSKKPAYTKFLQRYNARFKSDPGFGAINSYEATKIVIQALSKKDRKESLKDYIIRTASFDSIQGTIIIDRFGDGNRDSYISTVEDGRFIKLE